MHVTVWANGNVTRDQLFVVQQTNVQSITDQLWALKKHKGLDRRDPNDLTQFYLLSPHKELVREPQRICKGAINSGDQLFDSPIELL